MVIDQHAELKSSIQDMFPGVESPITSSSLAGSSNGIGNGYAPGFASGIKPGDESDDITPYPSAPSSPMMSATSLAGLSSKFT
jgi:hypothetical protein